MGSNYFSSCNELDCHDVFMFLDLVKQIKRFIKYIVRNLVRNGVHNEKKDEKKCIIFGLIVTSFTSRKIETP